MIWEIPESEIQAPQTWLFPSYYEATTVLFRLENALRVFFYVVLKNELKEKWADIVITNEEKKQISLDSIAKARISQAQNFGYLGYTISCPMMYLTFGEMIRVIDSEPYWKLFNKYFLGKKEIINKLDEIAVVRNALAHFRPLKSDDIESVKQNAKHVFAVIEETLNDLIQSTKIVPTNCSDDWYQELSTLGNETCKVFLQQSRKEEWVRIRLTYECPIVSMHRASESFRVCNVLTLVAPAILRKYPSLRGLATYLSEDVFSTADKDSEQLRKSINIVFSRRIMNENHSAVKRDLEELLKLISIETELMQQDNLARGEIVIVVTVTIGQYGDPPKYWWCSNQSLLSETTPDDPPEYWGSFEVFTDDFISAAHKYPWMPVPISKVKLPF